MQIKHVFDDNDGRCRYFTNVAVEPPSLVRIYSTHAASALGWTRTGKQTADQIGGTFPTEQLKDAILWVNISIFQDIFTKLKTRAIWGFPEYYPLVFNVAIENDHRSSGFSHKKWWFSIVMWVYQRVIIRGSQATWGFPWGQWRLRMRLPLAGITQVPASTGAR